MNELFEQLTLFHPRGPKSVAVGEYPEEHGKRLGWEDLYPGRLVLLDVSTQSHPWFLATVVKEIIKTPDDWRVILDGGKKHRPLVNKLYIDIGAVKLYAPKREEPKS